MLRSRKHCHGTHHGHELAPGPAREPELAGNRHGITLVCFIAAATLAVRGTRWGRQFWQLAGPYFSIQRSWRPLLAFALLLVLTLFSVRLNVLFSFWYNGFYSACRPGPGRSGTCWGCSRCLPPSMCCVRCSPSTSPRRSTSIGGSG
jgi:hypothetical protein